MPITEGVSYGVLVRGCIIGGWLYCLSPSLSLGDEGEIRCALRHSQLSILHSQLVKVCLTTKEYCNSKNNLYLCAISLMICFSDVLYLLGTLHALKNFPNPHLNASNGDLLSKQILFFVSIFIFVV